MRSGGKRPSNRPCLNSLCTSSPWVVPEVMTEEEPCGATHEIDAEMIVGQGFRRVYEGVTLVCSRPLNHIPANHHSDGVTDWLGEEM